MDKKLIHTKAAVLMLTLDLLGIKPGDEAEVILRLAAFIGSTEGDKFLHMPRVEALKLIDLQLDFIIADVTSR
jgi:hypothetical protein